ncbi:MAG: hypothetical protein ACYC0V_00935 [Armatimonadota bacterium]
MTKSEITLTASDRVPDTKIIADSLRDQLLKGAIEVTYTHAKVRDLQAVTMYRYVRTPDMQYLESKSPDGTVNQQIFRSKEGVGYYLTIKDNDKRGAIANWMNRGRLGYASLADPILFNLHMGSFVDQISTGYVLPDMVSVDGYECWKVEIAPNQRKPFPRCVAFVDPKIGCCLRRVESYTSTDYSIITQLTDYTCITEGVWYPMRMRLDAVAEEIVQSPIEIRVESVSMVDDSYANSHKVEFPSGTSVRDDIHNERYIVP